MFCASFFYAVLGINSSFAIIPLGKRELVAVYLQSLPHGVVGWSAVCDYGISWTLRFKNCAQHRRPPDDIPHIS